MENNQCVTFAFEFTMSNVMYNGNCPFDLQDHDKDILNLRSNYQLLYDRKCHTDLFQNLAHIKIEISLVLIIHALIPGASNVLIFTLFLCQGFSLAPSESKAVGITFCSSK